MGMNIYICSSSENMDETRSLAVQLKKLGHDVCSSVDPASLKKTLIPPEQYFEFDRKINKYREYISKPEWLQAVKEKKTIIERADLIILLLPCGIDSQLEWALGVGMKNWSVIVGQPHKGESSPMHNWANRIFNSGDDFIRWFKRDSVCVACGGMCLSCFAHVSQSRNKKSLAT